MKRRRKQGAAFLFADVEALTCSGNAISTPMSQRSRKAAPIKSYGEQTNLQQMVQVSKNQRREKRWGTLEGRKSAIEKTCVNDRGGVGDSNEAVPEDNPSGSENAQEWIGRDQKHPNGVSAAIVHRAAECR